MTTPATSNDSDEAILVDSQGRPELFTRFYDHHARALLAFFARRTFDAQVAADLTAETFAEAYACRGRYKDRGAGTAAAWLYTIGRRQLSHYIRRARVEQDHRARLHMRTRVVEDDDIARIEELIDFEAIGRAVAAAFGRLRADQREALAARIIDGLSYSEAARRLGCRESVVRQRVSRGLRRLATELDAVEVTP
jgi:RNA polymerase sigma factor (sigma-70 family)